MSSLAADRLLLRRHPSARISAPDAALPLAADDPHPLLTLALHRLWGMLHPFVDLPLGGEPSVVPLSPNQTPLQILEALAPFLVRS